MSSYVSLLAHLRTEEPFRILIFLTILLQLQDYYDKTILVLYTFNSAHFQSTLAQSSVVHKRVRSFLHELS